MVFLTQDGTHLVDVKYVSIKGVGDKSVIFGENNSTLPIKLGEFSNIESAKMVLLQVSANGLNIIPEYK